MNEKVYDQESMTAYLLGTLPAAEAEAFDELSFTDDPFAAALDAAEKELVDAYVRGALDGAARRDFETHYLASPLRREKLRFAAAFQDFGRARAAAAPTVTETVGAAAADDATPGLAARLLSGWRAFLRPGALSFGLAAATLLLAVAGFWLLAENNRLAEQARETERRRDELAAREQQLRDRLAGEQTASADAARELAAAREERERLEAELARAKAAREELAAQKAREAAREVPAPVKTPAAPRLGIASFVLAPPLRGAGGVPNFSIPAQTGTVRVRLQLEANEYDSYRVALSDQNGRVVWRSGALRPRTAGGAAALGVRFPAKLLAAGIYSFEVSGVKGDAAPENFINYTFRAVLE